MSLEEKIENEFKASMKQKDGIKVSTIRMLKAEINTFKLDRNKKKLADEEIIKIDITSGENELNTGNDNPPLYYEHKLLKSQSEKILKIVDADRRELIRNTVERAKKGTVEFLEEKAYVWEDKGYRSIGEAFRSAAKELK